MNIEEAKNYIKDTVGLYLKKDEYGDYKIPVIRQRPIFLLGAPGIGKTAIMEQIADEMGIALVSYAMSHHTRQSALGLPFIKHKNYGELAYDVSEYTMSEIIASIYETMTESGVTEGILFLDEINCVSETLAPSMLQFLQYKVFGRHSVPEGWVIVTAGNPPEYNKSVREFDVATLDRLKVIEVSADYDTWKKYAGARGVHGAIVSFLDVNRDYFYYMETTAKGRRYITARGWEDLSDIIKLYEEEGIPVKEELVEQYIRNDTVVKDFAAYYDLYNKYKNDYKIDKLLDGEISDAVVEKAAKAEFDERLSLLGMLMDICNRDMRLAIDTSDYLGELMQILRRIKETSGTGADLDSNTDTALREAIDKRQDILKKQEKANALSKETKLRHKRIIAFLEGCMGQDAEATEVNFNKEVDGLKEAVSLTKDKLHRLFDFTDRAFADGNEMLILVTELTAGKISSRFISTYGCEDYETYHDRLMLSDRRNEIKESIGKQSLL